MIMSQPVAVLAGPVECTAEHMAYEFTHALNSGQYRLDERIAIPSLIWQTVDARLVELVLL